MYSNNLSLADNTVLSIIIPTGCVRLSWLYLLVVCNNQQTQVTNLVYFFYPERFNPVSKIPNPNKTLPQKKVPLFR